MRTSDSMFLHRGMAGPVAPLTKFIYHWFRSSPIHLPNPSNHETGIEYYFLAYLITIQT